MKNCQVSSFTETILLTLKIICKVLQINIVVIIMLKWLSQGLYIVFDLRFSVNSLSDLLPPEKSDIIENRTTCTHYRSNLLWQVHRQITTSFWLHCLTSGWVGTIFFRWHVTGLKFEDRIPSSDCFQEHFLDNNNNWHKHHESSTKKMTDACVNICCCWLGNEDEMWWYDYQP